MAFGGAAANLGSAFGQILISTGDSEEKLASLGGAIDGLDKHTALSGHNAQLAGLAFAGFGAAVAGGFGLALNDAANFEQRMSAVEAVTGATGKTFQDLSDKALQLGKDTQYSATQAASAIEELAKAGVSVTDILNGAADAAVALAAAGGIELPAAATIIANTMNQFSIDGKDVASVADLFAAAASATAADVTSLGDSLNYVGATAHAVGMQLPEVIALLSALADQGLQGSAAGTALNQMILSLVAPTSAATDELAALGISVFDAQGNFKGATQFVKDFATATKGMTQEQRLAAENVIFTTHGMNALNLLLNDTTDSQIKNGKSLDDYAKAVTKAGAAQEQAKARMDNFRGSLEQLRGSVETIMIEVGDTFLAGARKIVDGATLVVNALIGLPKPVLEAVTAVIGLAGAVSALLGAYILLEPKIQAFKRGLNDLKPIIAGIAPELLLIAAAAAIVGFAFEHNFGGIKTKIDDVVGSAGQKLGDFAGVLGTVKGVFDHFFQADRTTEGLAHDINRMTDAFMGLGASRETANALSFALYDLRVPLVRLINDFNAVSKVVGGFFDIINGGASSKAVDTFKKYSDVLFGPKVGAQFAAATIQLRQSLHGLGQEIQATTGIDLSKLLNFKDLLLGLIGVVGSLAGFIDQKLLPVIGEGLTHGINGAIDVVQFLGRHIEAISGAVLTLAGDFKDILGGALSFVADVASGNIGAALTDLGTTVSDIFSAGVDVGAITIHLGGFLFTAGEDLLTKLLNWVYGQMTGNGVASTNAFGTPLPDQAGPNTTVLVPLGDVTVAIGGWLVTEAEDAAGTLLGKIKDKVASLLGIGGGDAASGAGGLGAGGAGLGGASGGVPIPDVGVSITGWNITDITTGAETLASKLLAKVLSIISGGGSSNGDQFGGSNVSGGLGTSEASGGIPLGTQGVSITGWKVSDITQGAESLAGKVGSAVGTAWDTIKDVAVPLADKAVSIGFKVADVAINLGVDIAYAIDGAWPAIRDDAKALGGKLLALGFKIADGAADLAADVLIAIDGWWPAIRDTVKALTGKLLSIGEWVIKEIKDGELVTRVGNFVTNTLTAMDIQITGFKIHVGSPGAKGITVDVAAIFGAIWDALTTPITVSAGTSAKADQAGRNIANALTGFIGDQLKKFFMIGGGDKPGTGGKGGEGIDKVVGNFIGGFIFQVFDNSVGAAATDIQNRLEKWTAGPNAWADGVNTWIDSLPGKVLGLIKAGGSGISGLIHKAVGAGAINDSALASIGLIITDKIIGLIGDGASIGADIVKGLEGVPGKIVSAIAGWISDLGGKIAGALSGGGGSDNASAAASGGVVGAALANGAGGNDAGGIITAAIKALLTPDLSKIGFPKLPDWVTNPIDLIPGLASLVSGLKGAVETVKGYWHDILHAGDDVKPPDTSHFPKPGAHNSMPGFTPVVTPDAAPTAGAGNSVVITTPVTVEPKSTGTPTPDSAKFIPAFLAGLGLKNIKFDAGHGGTADSGPLTVTTPIVFDTSDKPSNTAKQGSKNSAGAIADVLAGLGLSNVKTGSGGLTASTPPVTVDVPVSFSQKLSSDASKNQSASFTATFKADDGDVAKKYTDVFAWGTIWAAATFTGSFLGDNSGAGKQYAGAVSYGDAWDGTTYTGFFDGDNSGAGDQWQGAVSYGDDWASRVFTASFDIDTTGIDNAVKVVDAAVAHIASVLPHSPAEKGPLSRPISFDYIATNLAGVSARLKGLANDSAANLANAFSRRPNLASQLGGQSVSPAGSSGGVTVIQYSLHADEYATLLQNAQRGANADSWVRDYTS